jgi:hypothetical protein
LTVAGKDDARKTFSGEVRSGWSLEACQARGEAMSRVSKDEEARLAAEFERDAEDDELWEEVPAPAQAGPRRTLGTQVTIRLDGGSAEQLRKIAKERGMGYTSLLRIWIEERLNVEVAGVRISRPQVTEVRFGAVWKPPPLQLSGPGRMVSTGAA